MSRGFTFFELIITLLLISLMVLAVSGRLNSLSPSLKMARLATELKGFILLAKSQAIMRQQSVWIHLEWPEVGPYWQLTLTDSAKLNEGVVILRLSGKPFSGLKLKSNYSDNQISFDPFHGRPKNGRLTFYSVQAPQESLQVRTYYRSAMVRVCASTEKYLDYETC
ncbi:GspH/FimT family pseudopilin [Vibrio ostreicida]|uniref:GspH/FimT family pseudopilin n=1 Tax=Vibrio ostreicida TaxID=526588 RepID=UPI000970C24E|nr:GspH/FimT family protein [Vibrio ostreicida]